MLYYTTRRNYIIAISLVTSSSFNSFTLSEPFRTAGGRAARRHEPEILSHLQSLSALRAAEPRENVHTPAVASATRGRAYASHPPPLKEGAKLTPSLARRGDARMPVTPP